MSSEVEVVAEWSDDLRTPKVQDYVLATGSLAAYLVAIAILASAPPRVTETLTVRELHAAIDVAPQGVVALPDIARYPPTKSPVPGWQAPPRWPQPNELLEYLRAYDGFGSNTFICHLPSEAQGVVHGSVPRRVAHVVRADRDDVIVRGDLSNDVVRRIVQRNVNQVRFCYEQALQSKPDLQGRVAVQFIVGPTGAVQTAAVHSSSLGHAAAESCITSAVKRWSFPAPEGSGIVSVTYPFVLEQRRQ